MELFVFNRNKRNHLSKKLSLGLFKNVINKMCLEIIYLMRVIIVSFRILFPLCFCFFHLSFILSLFGFFFSWQIKFALCLCVYIVTAHKYLSRNESLFYTRVMSEQSGT